MHREASACCNSVRVGNPGPRHEAARACLYNFCLQLHREASACYNSEWVGNPGPQHRAARACLSRSSSWVGNPGPHSERTGSPGPQSQRGFQWGLGLLLPARGEEFVGLFKTRRDRESIPMSQT